MTREHYVGLCDGPDNRRIAAIFRRATRVAPSSQAAGIILFLPIFLSAILVIGAGYYLLVRRKKK